MTRNIEYYKLLALEQAVHSVYEMNSDSKDKFVSIEKPRNGDADLHASSECDLIVQCNHQKRLAQHGIRLAQVNQEKDTDHCESNCAVKPPEKIAATSSSRTRITSRTTRRI